MHPIKEQYAKTIFELITRFCSQLAEQKKSAVYHVLHISNADAAAIIKKVIIALPDAYFYNANRVVCNDMLEFISNAIVIFQAQEDVNNSDYVYNLINFISSLCSEIETRYYANVLSFGE
jgi:hypothetical protein